MTGVENFLDEEAQCGTGVVISGNLSTRESTRMHLTEALEQGISN